MDFATNSMNTVSAIAVLDLANELLERKFLTEERLSAHYPLIRGLAIRRQCRESNLILEEERLPETEFIKLWQETGVPNETSGIGLLIGCKVNPQAKGVLANWISHCETLGQAFSTFQNHIALLNPSEQWTQETLGNRLRLTFQFLNNDYPVSAVERSMSALVTWAEFFCEEELQILDAGFCHSKPAHDSQYYTVFGSAISFDNPTNFIELDANALDLPIPSSSTFLQILLREKATEILTYCQGSISYNLYQLVSADIAKFSRVEKVCEALHMSRSKLYRQLKNEGTSYSHILEKVRHKTAGKFKALGMDDYNIALHIGYQDVASYYKARRRWRQTIPKKPEKYTV